MTPTAIPGQLVVARDASGVAGEAGARIAAALQRAIAANGSATLALSGGNTPRDAYALLARDSAIDWSKVSLFWVDERAVAPTDDRSNFRWAKATLLDPAGIAPHQVHRMPAESPDGAAAAREYERTVRAQVSPDAAGVPAFDVLVMGVGDDGHTASLFPGEPTVDVVDRLVVAVPAGMGREARLSLTATAIEHARHVFVLAVGAGKRAALERVWSLEGDLRATPARVIRRCLGAVVWIVDPPAAGSQV
jgi:6-phosphogluconolactonase